MLKLYGISIADFNTFVRVNMAGETVSQVYDNGSSFNLVVRAAEHDRCDMERIRDLMIDTPDGRKIPLANVAEVNLPWVQTQSTART